MISLDAAGLWAAFCGESTAELVVLGLGLGLVLTLVLVEVAFGMLTSGVMPYRDLALTRRLCCGRLMRSGTTVGVVHHNAGMDGESEDVSRVVYLKSDNGAVQNSTDPNDGIAAHYPSD